MAVLTELHHAGKSRRVHDLRHAQRDGTEKDEQKECKVGGQMFVQIMMGQRVSTDGQSDVFKFSTVSFTLPDMIGKGGDLLRAVVQENPLFAELAKNAISFNRQDSLLGAFGSSSKAFTEEHLQILPRALQAAENLAITNKRTIPEDNLDEFLLKSTSWKMHVGNLIEDAKSIHSNPTHGGARAYRNSEKFGDKQLFRMEWLYSGGQVITPGPPSEGYKMSVIDERLVDKTADHGDSKFIRMMLDHIKASYESGAASVFGIQVNSTATVDRCGGADVNVELKKLDLLFNSPANTQQNGNTQISQQATSYSFTYGNNMPADSPSNVNATSGNSNSSSTSSSGNGGTEVGVDISSKTVSCQNCGRTMDKGERVCTCATLRQHVRMHR